MKIILAGFNVDTEILKDRAGRRPHPGLTPETISAAYARISRSPKTVEALRAEARQEVARARASNRRIIFEMGHHSVAEHAVFNFDIIGISRRAVEELENYRLCSYTEKSQRYVTLRGDYLVPKEIKSTPLVSEFRTLIAKQNRMYQTLLKELKSHLWTTGGRDPALQENARRLENLAKEDARYVLALATQTQLGATINARNLELMIRRFAGHDLDEIRVLGRRFHELAGRIAPSVILFYRANDYDQKTYPDLGQFIKRSGYQTISGYGDQTSKNPKRRLLRFADDEVVLVDHTSAIDDKILAALLFRTGRASYPQCRQTIRRMPRHAKIELFKQACRHMELYDVALREFEYADLTFVLTVSAACFGQLKRHRLATIVSQNYDPALGVTIPASVRQIGQEKNFLDLIGQTNQLYEKIEKKLPGVGSYILTNAHRKRVLMKTNLRELYHISRLREDPTAQWDIRYLTQKMCCLARKAAPIASRLLAGKTDYPSVYRGLYGHDPKITAVPEIK